MVAVHSFDGRMEWASSKEQADRLTLETLYRCKTYPFGQGQLPPAAHNLLKHGKSVFLRWLPDTLVLRPDLVFLGEWAWLVDSKWSSQPPEKYAYWLLEVQAHEAHRLQQPGMGMPIVYIWPDGQTCSYVDDLPDSVLLPGPRPRVGSGTPYWKVPKTLTRPLDAIFGKEVAS